MSVEINTHQGKVLKKHISHTHTPLKRKINISSMEINAPEVHEIPHAINMDELIEEPRWSAERLLEIREIVDAIIT